MLLWTRRFVLMFFVIHFSFSSFASSSDLREAGSCLRNVWEKGKKASKSCLRGFVVGASVGGFWNVGSSIERQASLGDAFELKMQNVVVAAAAGAAVGLFYTFMEQFFDLGLRDIADIISRHANVKIPLPEDSDDEEEDDHKS